MSDHADVVRAALRNRAIIPGYNREQALEAVDALEARVRELEAALREATSIARHLYGMIDSETWREHGGDDQQGHYEGDYRAATVTEDIKRLAALGGDEE